MMLRAPRKLQSGFTLIEVCAALFVITLLLSLAIPAGRNMLREQALREPARQLELFAKTARALAMDEQKPHEIKFLKRGFYVRVYRAPDLENPEPDDESVDAIHEFTLGDDVGFSIRPWGEEQHLDPRGFSWIFQPSGICEPLQVRFAIGNDWLEEDFNPLSANPQNVGFAIQ